jgi:hypothetical protein
MTKWEYWVPVWWVRPAVLLCQQTLIGLMEIGSGVWRQFINQAKKRHWMQFYEFLVRGVSVIVNKLSVLVELGTPGFNSCIIIAKPLPVINIENLRERRKIFQWEMVALSGVCSGRGQSNMWCIMLKPIDKNVVSGAIHKFWNKNIWEKWGKKGIIIRFHWRTINERQ